MAELTNRPDVDRLIRTLSPAGDSGPDLTGQDQLLDELLQASIAWIEDECSTCFDGRAITELYDGNGTNGLALRLKPITSVSLVEVDLPVLGLHRVYTQDEIKVYELQGRISIFTYKLQAEQAHLFLDAQVYGNIFPTLPQCVRVSYTYGFPLYDADANKTSVDGGTTWVDGDTRDPRLVNRMRQLQQAAICDAAASFLAQTARQAAGVVASVSFDGFSKSMNPQAYGPVVEDLVQKRDALMERNKRRMILTSA